MKKPIIVTGISGQNDKKPRTLIDKLLGKNQEKKPDGSEPVDNDEEIESRR